MFLGTFRRIRNLGIRDFILFNLFLFNIRDGCFSFVMTYFKTLDRLQELPIASASEPQRMYFLIVIDTVIVFL